MNRKQGSRILIIEERLFEIVQPWADVESHGKHGFPVDIHMKPFGYLQTQRGNPMIENNRGDGKRWLLMQDSVEPAGRLIRF